MAGKIFVNYRRGDDPGHAGRLFDRLGDAFRPDQIFMDVDSIAPGQDFVRVLEEQVAQCDVLLAIIGQGWIDARDEKGLRRLDNRDDFVRLEIEAGLKLGKRVVPVLVNGAEMPRAEALPNSLQDVTRLHAVRLTHDRFKSDAQGLIDQLKQVLAVAVNAAREKDRLARRCASLETSPATAHLRPAGHSPISGSACQSQRAEVVPVSKQSCCLNTKDADRLANENPQLHGRRALFIAI